MTAVRVKICGVTRSDDIGAAVSLGADALGFVFVPASKRCLENDHAAELCRRVPAFISRVGLFQDQTAEAVRRVLEKVPLNLLQFHGSEPPAYCRQFGLPYIKAISGGDQDSVTTAEQQFPDAAGIVVDSHQPGGLGGTGRTLDWDAVRPGALPLILAGGLTPANVAEAVRRVRPWAVDVSSGVEQAPGLKCAIAMKRFIEEAKSDY